MAGVTGRDGGCVRVRHPAPGRRQPGPAVDLADKLPLAVSDPAQHDVGWPVRRLSGWLCGLRITRHTWHPSGRC
jgi:hypothetical protein